LKNQGALFFAVIQPQKLDSRITTSIVDGMRITNGWNILFQRAVPSALHAGTFNFQETMVERRWHLPTMATRTGRRPQVPSRHTMLVWSINMQ
jgi:hypothetical protein